MKHTPAPALLIAVLASAFVSGACGAPAATGGPAMPDPGASALVITVLDNPDATPRTWTLTCDPPGGDHPDPAAACGAIDGARRPFLPKPEGMLCTQIYGGPQTATITGTWKGEAVDASYKRTDGCEIARWNALAAVLGSGGTGS